jgi:hypothetical protein
MRLDWETIRNGYSPERHTAIAGGAEHEFCSWRLQAYLIMLLQKSEETKITTGNGFNSRSKMQQSF